jgi:hypothetical protein
MASATGLLHAMMQGNPGVRRLPQKFDSARPTDRSKNKVSERGGMLRKQTTVYCD